MTAAPATQYFRGRDGVRLAYRETGSGRPLVLLHGFFTTGSRAWVSSGHAALLAAHGHRVVMVDLRAHGDSAKLHSGWAYPPDVLADDLLALVQHLRLDDYDLAGYSLGARTVISALTHGATPRRAVVGGAGFEQLMHAAGAGDRFRHVLDNLGRHAWGSRDWLLEGFLKKVGGDPVALLRVLDTPADIPRAAIADIRVPMLVVEGSEDDPESGRRLTELLPDARFVQVPGDHFGASGAPELAAAMVEFLA